MERLPGFRDFYPEPLPHVDVWSADARQYIFEKWRATARRYAFREYDGPPLDRPALRQLPREWQLETEKPPRDVDGIVGACIIWVAIFLFVATAAGWIK